MRQKKRSAATILALLFCVLPGCAISDTTKTEIQSIFNNTNNGLTGTVIMVFIFIGICVIKKIVKRLSEVPHMSIRRVVISDKDTSIRVERLELSKEMRRKLTTGVYELNPVRKLLGN